MEYYTKYNMSKIKLSLLSIIYIYILNLFSNHTLEKIIDAIWPALAMLIVFLIIGLLHKWILKTFLSLSIFIASVAIFFKWQYKITITEDILLSGLINEVELTLEMVSAKLIIWVFITAVIPIIILSLIQVSKYPLKLQIRNTVLLIGLSLILSSIIFVIQGYHFRASGQIRDPKFAKALTSFSPLDVEYNFKKALKALKNMNKKYKNTIKMSAKYNYIAQEKDLLVVVVLGESTRGDHLGINGYNKNTTPMLSQIKELYSFKDATSCDTLTKNSLDCLSTPMLKSQKDRIVHQSSFGEVFNSLGFNTEIYSLQTLNEFYHFLKYDKLVSKYAILDSQSTGAKDISLVPYAKESISQYKNGKKLIILHTIGSHQTYADRIMPNKEVFKPSCKNPDVAKCSNQELINAYDNSIIGVDYLLTTIINELKNKKAILIYLSDHGESLGENGNYFHGKPLNIAPKEQFDIPFIIWFSDKYAQTNNGNIYMKNIQKKLDNHDKISHDNFFHSALGCSGIISSNGGIDKSLDICQ